MGLAEDTVRRLAPIVGDPRTSAVLLDLDGTLAPIVARPDQVLVDDGVRRLLPSIAAHFALVAFLSGRQIDELERLVRLEGAAYSGNHGVEIRMGDGRRIPVPAAESRHEQVRAFAARWTPEVIGPWGAWLEDKGATLTFHYRSAPDPGRAAAELDAHVAAAARREGLVAEPGRMSLEIHPAGKVTKGLAARAILDATPDVRRVVSLGDDRTDVTIWRELRDVVAAGRLDQVVGIGVTSDETPPEVLREADALVPGIPGARAVLALLADAQPG